MTRKDMSPAIETRKLKKREAEAFWRTVMALQ
jgi:hypothetical protein